MPTSVELKAFTDAVAAAEQAANDYNTSLNQGVSDHQAADAKQAQADALKATALATDATTATDLATVRAAFLAASAAALVVAGDTGGGPIVPPVVTTGPITIAPVTGTAALGTILHFTTSKTPKAASVNLGGVAFAGTDVTFTAPTTMPPTTNADPVLATITVDGDALFEAADAVVTITA